MINHNKKSSSDSEALARLVAQGMSNKKGIDIVIIDLREVQHAPAAFFVVGSGNVPSHVDAMADGVYETVKQATGQMPRKMEGYDNAEWVLLDYFDVMAHMFLKEKRDFYRLEELWADGNLVAFEPEENLPEEKPSIKRTKAASSKKTQCQGCPGSRP
ncbi:MAG: ribosome silencing factor [Bacteroidales bacterium]|nr:ribosome silencing factor [Bacteroidales bacterium]